MVRTHRVWSLKWYGTTNLEQPHSHTDWTTDAMAKPFTGYRQEPQTSLRAISSIFLSGMLGLASLIILYSDSHLLLISFVRGCPKVDCRDLTTSSILLTVPRFYRTSTK